MMGKYVLNEIRKFTLALLVCLVCESVQNVTHTSKGLSFSTTKGNTRVNQIKISTHKNQKQIYAMNMEQHILPNRVKRSTNEEDVRMLTVTDPQPYDEAQQKCPLASYEDTLKHGKESSSSGIFWFEESCQQQHVTKYAKFISCRGVKYSRNVSSSGLLTCLEKCNNDTIYMAEGKCVCDANVELYSDTCNFNVEIKDNVLQAVSTDRVCLCIYEKINNGGCRATSEEKQTPAGCKSAVYENGIIVTKNHDCSKHLKYYCSNGEFISDGHNISIAMRACVRKTTSLATADELETILNNKSGDFNGSEHFWINEYTFKSNFDNNKTDCEALHILNKNSFCLKNVSPATNFASLCYESQIDYNIFIYIFVPIIAVLLMLGVFFGVKKVSTKNKSLILTTSDNTSSVNISYKPEDDYSEINDIVNKKELSKPVSIKTNDGSPYLNNDQQNYSVVETTRKSSLDKKIYNVQSNNFSHKSDGSPYLENDKQNYSVLETTRKSSLNEGIQSNYFSHAALNNSSTYDTFERTNNCDESDNINDYDTMAMIEKNKQ